MSGTPVAPADATGTLNISGIKQEGVTITVIPGAIDEDDLWTSFINSKSVPTSSAPTAPSDAGTSWAGGVVQTVSIPGSVGGSPGVKTLDFILAWHFPCRGRARSTGGFEASKILPPVLGNYYNNLYLQQSKAYF